MCAAMRLRKCCCKTRWLHRKMLDQRLPRGPCGVEHFLSDCAACLAWQSEPHHGRRHQKTWLCMRPSHACQCLGSHSCPSALLRALNVSHSLHDDAADSRVAAAQHLDFDFGFATNESRGVELSACCCCCCCCCCCYLLRAVSMQDMSRWLSSGSSEPASALLAYHQPSSLSRLPKRRGRQGKEGG